MKPFPTAVGVVFCYEDTLRWRGVFGPNVHPWLGQDLVPVTHELGYPQIADDEPMAVGIYVALNMFDELLYVGCICRDDPFGIVRRIAEHHAIDGECAALWLLPLRDDLPDHVVEKYEAEMIRAYCPQGNKQFSDRGRRHARACDEVSLQDGASA